MNKKELLKHIGTELKETKPFESSEAISIIEDFLDTWIFFDKDNVVIKNLDFNALHDDAMEFADSQIDIYYADIYKSLPKFIDSIEDARDEGILEGTESIDKQIQIGQGYAYDSLIHQAINIMEGLK